MDRYSNKQEKRSSYNEEGRREGGYVRNKRQGGYNRNRQENTERGRKYFHKNTQPETGGETRERKPRREFRREEENGGRRKRIF